MHGCGLLHTDTDTLVWPRVQPTSYRSASASSDVSSEASAGTSDEQTAEQPKVPRGGVALFNPFASGGVPSLKKPPAGAMAMPGMGPGMGGMLPIGGIKLRKRGTCCVMPTSKQARVVLYD
jgi:hypothetical protein